MNSSVILFFLLSSVITCILYFIVLIYSNHLLRKEERLSFLNSFPFEFYMNESKGIRIASYVLLFLNAFFLSLGLVFFISNYNSVYMSVVSYIMLVGFMCLAFSDFLSFEYYKAHIITSAIGFFSLSSSLILFSFGNFNLDFLSYSINRTYVIPFVFISFLIIGILLFISLFNPKLTKWANMEKHELDGKVTYEKPKINFYSFYEWLYFIIFNLIAVVFLIMQILI